VDHKKRILFLCPYPLGSAPSQRFRFEQYFQLLRREGYTIEVQPFLTHSAWRLLYMKGHFVPKAAAIMKGLLRRIWLLIYPIRRMDYIFIHREASPLGPPIIEFIIAKIFKKKMIFDFDDAIWLPNTSEENKLIAWAKWHSKAADICRWSTAVSCGNEYLKTYAAKHNPHIVLNPTTIDVHHLHNPGLHLHPSKTDVITIGWTGTHSTLQFLYPLQKTMATIEKRFDGRIRFVVIADRKPALSIASLHFVPWSIEREIPDLLTIDIGLMPLEDEEWSLGKCGLKVLQYMALQIPTVASSIGVNRSIIEHGTNGFLCDSPESWERSLILLIESERLRKQMGEAGRQTVLSKYSIEANQETFLSLFE